MAHHGSQAASRGTSLLSARLALRVANDTGSSCGLGPDDLVQPPNQQNQENAATTWNKTTYQLVQDFVTQQQPGTKPPTNWCRILSRSNNLEQNHLPIGAGFCHAAPTWNKTTYQLVQDFVTQQQPGTKPPTNWCRILSRKQQPSTKQPTNWCRILSRSNNLEQNHLPTGAAFCHAATTWNKTTYQLVQDFVTQQQPGTKPPTNWCKILSRSNNLEQNHLPTGAGFCHAATTWNKTTYQLVKDFVTQHQPGTKPPTNWCRFLSRSNNLEQNHLPTGAGFCHASNNLAQNNLPTGAKFCHAATTWNKTTYQLVQHFVTQQQPGTKPPTNWFRILSRSNNLEQNHLPTGAKFCHAATTWNKTTYQLVQDFVTQQQPRTKPPTNWCRILSRSNNLEQNHLPTGAGFCHAATTWNNTTYQLVQDFVTQQQPGTKPPTNWCRILSRSNNLEQNRLPTGAAFCHAATTWNKTTYQLVQGFVTQQHPGTKPPTNWCRILSRSNNLEQNRLPTAAGF